ncbi:MAG: efflux RND transporter permease subunit [Pirellulaceae bacterium]|nr:efflux RND transporter permease subunit [Pirellulaceae bacterium]
MNLSEPFIRRPVATTLLTLALTLAGAIGYFQLPVSPLPQVDFPTISVSASLPGASPETMATSVATPLERALSRIAGVTEMTSTSSLGSTSVTLQFELDRDVNGAAREVQAAINAARSQLPANLPNNPSYRKVNPADSPIMLIALISEVYTKPQMYEYASTILQQKLSQVPGVGQVFVAGGSAPAVRIDVNPTILNQYNLGLEDLRTALGAANANRPKGMIEEDNMRWTLNTTDQLMTADEYQPLLVAYRNGAPIRLRDVADVTDSVEDVRSFGLADGRPSISVLIFRQPGANIIATVDRIKELLPTLDAQLPAEITLDLAMDRSATIRASLEEVQRSLMISVCLVIVVVYLFLRDWKATIIPAIAVPVSLVGTFGVMYLLDYSLDNLSLMALTIATGFVVDDAIVVTENISRYLEKGMPALEASIRGAREIGFTVLSITVSLIAVFIPILLMRGAVGMLFREFAVTLSVAILISLVISLTTAPMLCALLLKPHKQTSETKRYWLENAYGWCLSIVLRFPGWTLIAMAVIVGFNVYLYVNIAKGFFPQQDTGRLVGNIVADQGTSFQATVELVKKFGKIVSEEPAVDRVLISAGGMGGGSSNSARAFVTLKPLSERKETIDAVLASIRKKSGGISGANLFMQPVQEIRIGGRPTGAQYQYTLRGSNLKELNEWSVKLMAAMRKIPEITDVNADQQDKGRMTRLVVNRDVASAMGIDFNTIDNTLYDAFGQRPVSTMFRDQNQYRVVMQLQSQFAQTPEALTNIYLRSPQNSQIPLQDLYEVESRNTSLSVAHSGLFPSVTISFNLSPGSALGDVVPLIEGASAELGMPEGIQGSFQGTAQAFQDSLSNQPMLILAALIAVYIVLGVLYESYIHPLTILSTLPSAGVGAILALILFRIDLNVIGMIGILLLIGIVKKNAIMMIDFAIIAERERGWTPRDAIFEACLRRFRPIMMTTLAALFGALPLALGRGDGAELRQPLGIAIVGGLIVSQFFTLFTTPVVYLYLDQFMTRRRKAEPLPQDVGILVNPRLSTASDA